MFLQHLKIDSKLVSPYVLLPGDPDRVDLIGEKLDSFSVVGQNREFRIGVGSYRKVPITVCSTGVGCPSTAIAVEELIGAGAKILIRVGTCGGAWRREISAGSLVIPTACVRDEGTTREYVLEGFPAVADFEIVRALVKAAQNLDTKYFVGINRTHDAYYGSLDSRVKWGSYLTDERWRDEDTPILSSDMETAVLFVIASLRNVKAGAVLAVNADPEPLRDRVNGLAQDVVIESGPEITSKTLEGAVNAALNAIGSLN